jgi:thioredoxin-like negative regulator of GroEL
MDSTTAELLADAVRLHRQGMLAEATERYAQVLRNEPANADVLYASAQISCQQGRLAEGVDFPLLGFKPPSSDGDWLQP